MSIIEQLKKSVRPPVTIEPAPAPAYQPWTAPDEDVIENAQAQHAAGQTARLALFNREHAARLDVLKQREQAKAEAEAAFWKDRA